MSPAIMDKPKSNTYMPPMIERFVTMLAILSIIVVTTVTSAHAARMSDVPDIGAHAVGMVQDQNGSAMSCGGGQPCGSAEAGLCALACVGLSAVLSWPDAKADLAFLPVGHGVPSGVIQSGSVPELTERPPKLCFL